MPLYLGIDASTQSLTAIVLEIDGDTRRVVFNQTLNFDRDFPEYGTIGGVTRGDDGTVTASPLMWADALDRMQDRLDRHRHMEGIGMNERRLVPHDGNMAVPEQ